jgi:RHS repeat-associated protein
MGNLLSVILPTGSRIEYIIDGGGRRIARRVNGVIVQRWLYRNGLQIAAELDSTNKIVKRFIFTGKINVPDYMIKDGIVYRIVTDNLGSVRQVINATSGFVEQLVDYDEYGRMILDTNPGFTPFGFSGGLYDSQTKLVRFGSRDYEPELGRWMTKDPILFGGKSTNLYRYVACDPINLKDPKGLVNYNKMDLAALEYTKGCMTMLLGYLEIILDYELYIASYPLSSFGYGIPGMTVGIVGMTYGFFHILEGEREVINAIADFSEAMIE